MVTITNIKTSEKQDGSTFTSFVLEGGIELLQSQNTGKFYAKGKRALLNTTLGEEAAKAMIGTSLPGSIQRVPCEPYEYTVKESGEVVTLYHSYEYSPIEETTVTKTTNLVAVDTVENAPFETV
jgi:hypothetical protein